ncbi:MAG: class I SAM-dependent methyltransferase [Saprospiraceae bacterium]|nr:class I SAM-dependent methyltransferase [Saprospiraceae bacterium]
MRKPFQGVWNVIRFNWHFYVIAVVFLFISILLLPYLTSYLLTISIIFIVLFILNLLVSTGVTYYIYDRSGLYQLKWLPPIESGSSIVNITAGFDEISPILYQKYPSCPLTVLDFYDAKKHTEVSIQRARKIYPPFPGTVSINSTNMHIPPASKDIILAFLSVHEIRKSEERILFFSELKKMLQPNGKIIVVEHLRDLPNFIAYTIGFLHFHSNKTWCDTFASAGLVISNQEKLTPFITKYILFDGNTP